MAYEYSIGVKFECKKTHLFQKNDILPSFIYLGIMPMMQPVYSIKD